MINILVCGLYFSGSSALTDLLSEYDSLTVVPGEFDDIRRAGMLGDHALATINASNPSKINAACNGFWHPTHHNPTVIYHIKQLIKKTIINTPLASLYKGGQYKANKHRASLLKTSQIEIIKESDFSKRALLVKNHINNVANLYRKPNDSFIVFDQPIYFNTHQDLWPTAFDPLKLLIVYRDPRDQISQLIKNNLLFFDIETPTRGLIEIYGNTRAGAIRYELDTLQARFSNAKKLQEKLGKDKVKIISFENLVNNYDEEKKSLEVFLGLDPSKHAHKRTRFNPDISSKNIGLYKDILTADDLLLFENINSNLNF